MYVSLIELLRQEGLGHHSSRVGVAQGVEEGEPEEGVAGLVAVAIPDQ